MSPSPPAAEPPRDQTGGLEVVTSQNGPHYPQPGMYNQDYYSSAHPGLSPQHQQQQLPQQQYDYDSTLQQPGLIRDDRGVAEKVPVYAAGYMVSPQSALLPYADDGIWGGPPRGNADGGGAGGKGAISAEESARRSRRLVWILAGVIVVLVILGAVLGGVLGSRAAQSQGGSGQSQGQQGSGGDSPSSTTGTVTPGATETVGPSLNSIRRNSGLGVVAYRRSSGIQASVFYQDPEGTLRFSVQDQDQWAESVAVPIETNATVGTRVATAIIVAGEQYNPQRELFFFGPNNQLRGVSMHSSSTIQPDSINRGDYTAHPDSHLATYWPFILFVNINGDLTEVRNRLIGDRNALWLQPQSLWNTRSLGMRPARGSRIAVVPLSSNYTVTQSYLGGAYGVFVQQANGALTAFWPDRDNTVIPLANQSWPHNKADAPSFPAPTLPIGASFAAFAAATASSPELNRVDTYLLYQDTSASGGGRISLMFLGGGETEWKTSSPSALATADNGTDITCATMPQSHNDFTRSGAELPLEAASSDSARCYFQRGGKLVEVRLTGLDVSDPSELPLS